MYLEAIVLGIVIGRLRKGRLSNFLELRFKGWYLAIVALVLFLIPYVLRLIKVETPYMPAFPYAAMVLCVVVALLNHREAGMKLFLIGLILNLAIMGMNGFRMPVDTDRMIELGYSQFVESIEAGEVVNYTKLEGTTGFSLLLGKVHRMPKWYPLSTVLSVGDILVCLGILWVVQGSMRTRSKSSVLQFSFRPGAGRKY